MNAPTVSVVGVQPMPPLSPGQFAALRADIADNGVRVPVFVDQHGRLLDGHNRVAIAAELGIDCPREVVQVADDEDAWTIAVTLNCARRHLTREQRRDLILTENARRPGDSDRAIARRVGCSPSTVAAVLRPQVSNLDTSSRSYEVPADVDADLRGALLALYDEGMPMPAESPTSDRMDRWCQRAMIVDADSPLALSMLLARTDAEQHEVAAAVLGKMALWRSRGMDRALVRRLFVPWLDITLSPSKREEMRCASGERAPLDDEQIDALLGYVASVPSFEQIERWAAAGAGDLR